MTPDIAEELARWLEAATQGLPQAAQAVVRAEIEAHYADAVSDHRASGKTAEEAHRAAMADLGDVRATARALRDTHLARQRYVRAALLSLAATFLFVLLPVLYAVPGIAALTSIVLRVALPVAVFYTFYSLKMLLGFYARSVDRPIAILVWSAVVFNAACALIWILFNQPPAIESGERSLWAAAPFGERALDLIAFGGEVVTDIALFLLWLGLMKMKDPVYGLLSPLRFLLLAVGCADLGFLIAIALEAHLPAMLLGPLASLMLILVFALMTLIFFRAAYRRAAPPLRSV
jgi:hypothetical protein